MKFVVLSIKSSDLNCNNRLYQLFWKIFGSNTGKISWQECEIIQQADNELKIQCNNNTGIANQLDFQSMFLNLYKIISGSTITIVTDYNDIKNSFQILPNSEKNIDLLSKCNFFSFRHSSEIVNLMLKDNIPFNEFPDINEIYYQLFHQDLVISSAKEEALVLAKCYLKLCQIGIIKTSNIDQLKDYLKILSLDPTNIGCLFHLAIYYERIGRGDIAYPYITNILDLNPNYKQAIELKDRLLSRYSLDEKKYQPHTDAKQNTTEIVPSQENIDIVQKSVDISFIENSANNWIDLAKLEKKEKNYLKAIAYYLKALTISGKIKYPWHNIGTCYYHLNQYEKAIFAYDQNISLFPDYVISNLCKGRSLVKMYDLENAAKCFEIVINSGNQSAPCKIAEHFLDEIRIELNSESLSPTNSNKTENGLLSSQIEHIRHLIEIINNGEGTYGTHYRLAVKYFELNCFKEAEIEIDYYLENFPLDNRAKELKNQIVFNSRNISLPNPICSEIKNQIQDINSKCQEEITLHKSDVLSLHDAIREINNNIFIQEREKKIQNIIERELKGVQRIRGIAGTGKTIILCHRAAYLHKIHPEWKIALVFFTKSLYDMVETTLQETAIEYYDLKWNPQNQESNLRVMHAWGSEDKPGFFSILRKEIDPGSPNNFDIKNIQDKFSKICQVFLQRNPNFDPFWDVVLLDEAQDILTDNQDLLYNEAQPAFWLIYHNIKPINQNNKAIRRLVFAYDEYQTLGTIKIPSASEVFGKKPEYSNLFSKGLGDPISLDICYRTPLPTLLAAQGIGMGLYRESGMITTITTVAEWEELGYSVEMTGKKFDTKGNVITLSRTYENTKNPLSIIWTKPIIEFKLYETRESEGKAIHSFINDLKSKGIPQEEIAILLIERKIDIKTEFSLEGINVFYPDKDKTKTKFKLKDNVTIGHTPRAKGNEAKFIIIPRLDTIAKELEEEEKKLQEAISNSEKEKSINKITEKRNYLYVAMTRTKGWLIMTGIKGDYSLYREINRVLKDVIEDQPLRFTYNGKIQDSVK
jgi:superfamily I DNA and RNA helicase